MLLRAWIAACAAALAVSSATESKATPPQDPAPAPAAKSGCFVAGDGYLRARLRGALDLDLDWKDAQMQCEGGPRPSGNGVRVSIGGPARGDGRRIRIVFGIGGISEGTGGKALRTNVTILFEGEQRVFATLGDDKCTVDSLTQQARGVARWRPRYLSRGSPRFLPRAGHQPLARRAGACDQFRFCRPGGIQRR